jgi:4-amino-4-deoxy-L-arabinose transferase-like glycosyltransferase
MVSARNEYHVSHTVPTLMPTPDTRVTSFENAALYGRAASWAVSPGGATTLLILMTLAMRLTFGAALGLGFDESYMVAAGRDVQWGYFDHPPVAWWLAWGAAQLAGTDAAVVVRLPFILLFVLTTALMYRLTSLLFSKPAGFWAACLLNVMPVLGFTAGSWVLPDGPLLASLMAMALCLWSARRSRGATNFSGRWGWWVGLGVSAGVALSSKYTGILTCFGAICFLITDREARRWLRHPQPYLALVVMLVVFAPVIVWNATHGWISFAFQAGRAGGHFHPFGPLSTLAGEALFIIPWVWVPAIVLFGAALRRGPADPSRWFCACFAAPPIVIFALLSFRSHVLFHWASPGYMMLAPLMGEAMTRLGRRSIRQALEPGSECVRNGQMACDFEHRSGAACCGREQRSAGNARQMAVPGAFWVRLLAATAVFLIVALAALSSEAKYNWMPGGLQQFTLGSDSDLEIVDWTSLRAEFAERGLSGRPGLIIAATKWYEAGKIDYALGGSSKVICLGSDLRQYGMTSADTSDVGSDLLIVAPRKSLEAIEAQYRTSFDKITQLPPAVVLHNGRPALLLQLFLGHNWRGR